jgi:hypothetical protein
MYRLSEEKAYEWLDGHTVLNVVKPLRKDVNTVLGMTENVTE